MAQPRVLVLTPADQVMAVATLVDNSMGRWNADQPKGAAVTVQYSFGTKLPSYAVSETYEGRVSAICPCCGGSLHVAGGEARGYTSDTLRTAASTFQLFDATTRQQARDALAAWSAVANIDFIEVADSESVGMRFFNLSDPGAHFSGFAWGSGPVGWVGKGEYGDIWLNRAKTNEEYNPMVLMHEIGHTLGLKHPHEAPVMSRGKNSLQTTTMTYETDYTYDIKITVTHTGWGFDWKTEYVRLEMNGQAHLGIFDVAAAQALYGVRVSIKNDTYRFSTDPFTKMIYDGGGQDTIDLSNQAYGSILDLTPGSFSSIGKRTVAEEIDRKIAALPGFAKEYYGGASLQQWLSDHQEYLYLGKNNLSIAYDAVIERVIGSKGNDKIIGNSADNWIEGGLGDDVLLGGDGVDTAYFSGKYSEYRFKVEKDSLVVSGPDGRDVLIGFEKLEFSDGKIIDVKDIDTTKILSVPAYRFYNTSTNAHLYTINTEERDLIQRNHKNYTYEGEVFNAYPDETENALAVYRFYNKKTGAHFYTANVQERASVLKLDGFSDEGIAYYASATAGEGRHPLYRFYNTNTGAHFYTANEMERVAVTKLAGFHYEGIAYYVEG